MTGAIRMPDNRHKTGKRVPQRKNSRSFQPGRSGNPLGRPALTPEQKVQETALIQACRERTRAALAVIETLMRTADRDSVKLAAAQFIIERGHGKAIQRNELGVHSDKPIIMEHRFLVEVVKTSCDSPAVPARQTVLINQANKIES
jgi:hypothetical protein